MMAGIILSTTVNMYQMKKLSHNALKVSCPDSPECKKKKNVCL